MNPEQYLLVGLGLVAIGLLLVIVEVFIPSHGLIAITSFGCALGGIYCLFKYSTMWGIIGIGLVLVLGPTSIGFALRIWPSTPIGRKMLGEIPPEEQEAQRLAALKERERLMGLVGAVGKAVSDLRPIGVVLIDGQRHDALSETGFIPAGSKVKVTVVEGNQVKVRATV